MRFNYMKDIVLDDGIPTKFISYILELYFIYYGFSKFINEQVQLVHIREPLVAIFTHGTGHAILGGSTPVAAEKHQELLTSERRKME
jgi:hypothetical protein